MIRVAGRTAAGITTGSAGGGPGSTTGGIGTGVAISGIEGAAGGPKRGRAIATKTAATMAGTASSQNASRPARVGVATSAGRVWSLLGGTEADMTAPLL